MSREIKFRAWDTNSKEMYEIGCLDCPWPYDEIKIMQFTCIRDSKGQGIWEGDICEVKYVCPVCFENAPHVLRGEITPTESSGTWLFDYGHGAIPIFQLTGDMENSIEVIGNLYENPELLEAPDAR